MVIGGLSGAAVTPFTEKMCTAVYRPLAEKRRGLLGFFLVKRL